MATFAELRATIDDDLIATPVAVTDAHIDEAIKAAIRNYETDRFWFNESREIQFTTTADQSDYDEDDSANLGNVMHADYLVIDVNGDERRMTRERPSTVSWLLEGDTTSNEPYLWTYFGGKFRLFPTPDDEYTIRITGFIKYDELTDDTDENVWTTEGKGYDLIRARAKWHIANNITKDEQEATRASAAEEVAYIAALKGTGQRTAQNLIVPRLF